MNRPSKIHRVVIVANKASDYLMRLSIRDRKGICAEVMYACNNRFARFIGNPLLAFTKRPAFLADVCRFDNLSKGFVARLQYRGRLLVLHRGCQQHFYLAAFRYGRRLGILHHLDRDQVKALLGSSRTGQYKVIRVRRRIP